MPVVSHVRRPSLNSMCAQMGRAFSCWKEELVAARPDNSCALGRDALGLTLRLFI